MKTISDIRTAFVLNFAVKTIDTVLWKFLLINYCIAQSDYLKANTMLMWGACHGSKTYMHKFNLFHNIVIEIDTNSNILPRA